MLYATAKAALTTMMVSIVRLLNEQVRMKTVLIGTVITEGYGGAGIRREMHERLMHPDNLIGRPGRPHPIANAASSLRSPAASWVGGRTGTIYGVAVCLFDP